MFLIRAEPQIRAAALNGLQATGHKNAFAFVIQALEDDQIQVQRMAGRLVSKFPGEQQTEAFTQQLFNLTPAGQVLLLNGLKEGDPAAVPGIEAICGSGDIAVRCAAVKVLGRLGNAAHVSLLATRAAYSSGAEQEAARTA